LDPHRDSDRHQNRAYNRLSLVTHPIPPERNLLKFVDTYLSYPANGQTSVREYVFYVFFRFQKNMTFYVFLK